MHVFKHQRYPINSKLAPLCIEKGVQKGNLELTFNQHIAIMTSSWREWYNMYLFHFRFYSSRLSLRDPFWRCYRPMNPQALAKSLNWATWQINIIGDFICQSAWCDFNFYQSLFAFWNAVRNNLIGQLVRMIKSDIVVKIYLKPWIVNA